MKAGTETRSFSGMLSVTATCRDCEWASSARNATGTGAQHAQRLGHRVRIERVGVTVFAPAGMPRDEALAPSDREVCRG